MAFDPYRILGVPPGASQPEIKRAYRQLVKAYHPDSAGPGEIQRFLTIQRAYELLKTPGARRFPSATRPAGSPPPAPEPWRADPERARATREGARRRGGPASAWGTASGQGTEAGPAGPAAGSTGRRRPAAAGPSRSSAGDGTRRTTMGGVGSDGRARADGTDGPRTTGSGAGRHDRPRRRPTRKATFGSTSYDEARDQADPTWHGASWYGPTLGEYWTVNPREYADPRKHGPEYLARARRRATSRDIDGSGPEQMPGRGAAEAPRGGAGPTDDATHVAAPPESPASPPDGSATATAGRDLDRDAGEPPAASATGTAASPRADAAAPALRRDPRTARSAARIQRADHEPVRFTERRSLARDDAPGPPGPRFGGLAPEVRDPLRRFVLALIAWPPLGIAASTALGSVTGCAVASASCTDVGRLLPWLAQAAILGVLLALPTLAAVLAAGTVTALVASVPVTALLVALGANYDPPHATVVLAVLLALAWVAGVALATRRRLARSRASSRGPSPVS